MVLSDYLIEFLVKKGIKDIFLVSGGGIMYLLDAVERNKKIKYISNHHEQASATSAEAYARVKNHISACLVTTGPGGTNAITGIAGAWVDSIPIIIISGQVKKEIIADYSKTRQIGPQEINITDMVKPITKYAVTILRPETIKYHLEKAFYLSINGRPGPVWLEIPLDVQSAQINEKKLKGFLPPLKKMKGNTNFNKNIAKTIYLLKNAKRPVVIAGHGVRLAGAEKEIIKLINKLKVPVITNLNGIDIIPHNNIHFMGIYGPGGYRSANLVLQNSDLILSIGSGLNVVCTGFDFKRFAPKAKKIAVNIDKGVLSQAKIEIDLPIKSDAKEFLRELIKRVNKEEFYFSKKWLNVCNYWKKKYPLIVKEFYRDEKHVNSYVFYDILSGLIPSNYILTTGIGLDVVSFYQAFRVKDNQRAFVNKNFGQMGWCLPATIGACIANNRKDVVCVTGDGSFQLNIQELATIDYYKLPIKIFVFNNKGYKSIRDTQNNLFNGRLIGADNTSGVSNPNFKKIAEAYNLKYEKIMNNNQLKNKIQKVLETKGPIICEVNIAYDQIRMPRSATYKDKNGVLHSRPLEDMFPFLPREEVRKNMHMFDKETR